MLKSKRKLHKPYYKHQQDGLPSLEFLPNISGNLTCFYGTADPLIPASNQEKIQEELKRENPEETRFSYIEIEDT